MSEITWQRTREQRIANTRRHLGLLVAVFLGFLGAVYLYFFFTLGAPVAFTATSILFLFILLAFLLLLLGKRSQTYRVSEEGLSVQVGGGVPRRYRWNEFASYRTESDLFGRKRSSADRGEAHGLKLKGSRREVWVSGAPASTAGQVRELIAKQLRHNPRP